MYEVPGFYFSDILCIGNNMIQFSTFAALVHRPSIPFCLSTCVIQLSPSEFSRRACAELSVGLAFVQPMAQSINEQLIEFKRKFPGWALEGMIAPAVENIQVLDIDVRFRSVVYRDKVRWDINCLHNSPERFARSTVADLNLPQASFTCSISTTASFYPIDASPVKSKLQCPKLKPLQISNRVPNVLVLTFLCSNQRRSSS